MDNVEARVERMVEELTGNEALLEMLDTEAATELLNWGIEMGTAIVKGTEGMDEAATEQELQPRLKAVRQTMRSVGNWAAGKYADSESRIQLRDKLSVNFRLIFGNDARLPSQEEIDQLLGQVDVPGNSPHQLIVALKRLLEPAS